MRHAPTLALFAVALVTLLAILLPAVSAATQGMTP